MIEIPISRVHLAPGTEDLVIQVLRSGQLAQGPMVAELEARFREVTATRHAVAVSNGTVALVAALEALGVGPGDEVVTSPFTFAATLNAILEVGATPKFVDIGRDFNIDASLLGSAITSGTRVIMPVHLYGYAASMDQIMQIADAAGCFVVEDAAQAHGATFNGAAVGSFGIGCFSFYGTKNITTGEGGMVTTDDDAVADRIRTLRNQGMSAQYEYVLPGHNYRMTDVQAAIGVPQIDRLSEISSRRRAHAAVLDRGLSGIEGVTTPPIESNRTHVYHQYTIRVDRELTVGRDRLRSELADRGIGSGVYYPRVVFDYPCYRDLLGDLPECPEAERAADEVLSLPVHPDLDDGDLERIIDAVREVCRA